MFITFEGGEGVGKSTQVQRLVARLRSDGHDVVATREPGGSPKAEALRHLLLSGSAKRFGPEAEAILFAAARIDHVARLIAPNLAAGRIVVCDRFIDSTRAYQGSVGHVAPEIVQALERIAAEGAWPDLTVILDLPGAVGLRRAAARAAEHGGPDRFEREELAFHEQLRSAFLAIAKTDARRCVVVDAERDADSVEDVVWAAVAPRLRSVASKAAR